MSSQRKKMNIKKLLHCFIALMTCASIATAAMDKPKIAVLKGGDKRHNNEFDEAFKKLGWTADFYDCNTNGMKKLAENLSNYDIVMAVPLFNWPKKEGKGFMPDGSMDKKAFTQYLNNGGMLILTDASYAEPRAWLEELGPEFKLETGNCNSSPWVVQGWVQDPEEGPHPIRSFPNRIKEANSWAHYLKPDADSKWKTIGYCSEGFPVTLIQHVGKGLVVVTVLRTGSVIQVQNYFAGTWLNREGVQLKSFEISPTQLGDGSAKMVLVEPLKEKAKLVYVITGEDGKEDRFEADFNGTTCEMNFRIAMRGPITASLTLEFGKTKIPLVESTEGMPQLVTLNQNSYRGILSTNRRFPEVKFDVDLAIIEEDLSNGKISLEVFNAKGKKVASKEEILPAENIPSNILMSVPMKTKLPAGDYTVKATLLKKGKSFDKFISEVPLTILEAIDAQTVIDEDGTFLVGGKPFFPLGIFHAGPDVYPRLKEIGFNTVHYWQWMNGSNEEGGKKAAETAMAHDLVMFCEMNHAGLGSAQHFVRNIGKYPAVLMWSIGDEPNEAAYPDIIAKRKMFHELDLNHPTYLTSMRDDVFREQAALTDVFGVDPYGKPELVAKWAEMSKDAVDGRKANVVVVGATDKYTLEVIRTNPYAALVHDARGILWYPWAQFSGGPQGIGLNKHPDRQEIIQKVCSEIRTMTPALTSTYRRPFKMDESVHAMVCGTKKGEMYLIMVNLTDKDVDVEYTVDELVKVKKVNTPFIDDDPENIELNDGIINKKFGPYEILVYNW